ncbi:ppsC [Acrasis kona]|uniref:PpsC n=1 Tax=Acrasis kona TaxID=1008807 RepID=A0AAW2ZLK7_9EUKA
MTEKRVLGTWEHWCLEMRWNVCVWCDVNGPPLDLDKSKKAVANLIKRHPNLKYDAVRDGDDFEFVSLTNDEIPFSTQTTSEADFISFIENCLDTPFVHSQNNYLWNVTLLQIEGTTLQRLVITFSHSIGDGTSAMILVKDFLSYYQNPFIEVEELVSLPNITELMFPNGTSKSDDDMIETIANEIVQETKNKKFCLSWDDDTNLKGNGVVLSQIQLTSILNKCKTEKTTIGSAIIAACELELGKSGRSTEIDVDFNVRKRLDSIHLGDDHVGMLIAIDVLRTAVDVQDFWERARQIRQELNRMVDSRSYQHCSSAIDKADEKMSLDESFAKLYEEQKMRYVEMNISNIGMFPFPTKYGEHTIKDMHIVGSNQPEGMNYLLLCNGINDKLCFSLVYDKALFKRETATGFLNNVISTIEQQSTTQ